MNTAQTTTANEINGLEGENFNAWLERQGPDGGSARWDDPDLARFLRVRFLTDRGWPLLDLSYAYGQMRDGSVVRLSEVPGWRGDGYQRRTFKRDAVTDAIKAGVNLKAKGFFDAISILF